MGAGALSLVQFELVVYSGSGPLLTADVAFRSLHRDMTEKELDLLNFSAGGTA
jgi:hypothetical protein